MNQHGTLRVIKMEEYTPFRLSSKAVEKQTVLTLSDELADVRMSVHLSPADAKDIHVGDEFRYTLADDDWRGYEGKK